MAADRSFEDIAAELYAVVPEQFVAARKTAAAQIEDSDLAARVKSLRKPLLAAWVVNLFASERAGELAEVLELAQALREAQEDLDAASLTQLGRQRRALVRSLAKKAADLAGERGERITASTVEAVEQTLNATMFDPAAAAAVASRRLLRPLAAAEDEDPSDAVAGALDVAVAQPAEAPPDELAARRARKEAERALRTAEDELARAERAQSELERRARTIDERRDVLSEQAERLRAELARVEADIERAVHDAAELADEQEAATGRVDEARAAVEEARSRVP